VGIPGSTQSTSSVIFFGPKAKLVFRYHMNRLYFHVAVREQDFEFRIPPRPFLNSPLALTTVRFQNFLPTHLYQKDKRALLGNLAIG
jgi:hypothetical protein